jgi:hypothetical protein
MASGEVQQQRSDHEQTVAGLQGTLRQLEALNAELREGVDAAQAQASQAELAQDEAGRLSHVDISQVSRLTSES